MSPIPAAAATHRSATWLPARYVVVATTVLGALWLLTVGAMAAQDRVVVEEGADAVDRSALVAEVERAEDEGLLLSVSVLAGEPSGGAEAEADRIVDATNGAALVITPAEVGGVSDETAHDTAGAVDRALDQLAEDDDIVAATRAFSDHLLEGGASGGIPGLDAAGDAGDVELPVIGRVSVILLIVVVVGFILLLSVLRFLGRLFGGGRRRGEYGGRRRRGGMLPGAAVGYGLGRSRRNRRSGTSGGSSARRSGSRGGGSRGRSSGSRSRSGGSRGGRSRGSGRRR